MTTTVYVYPTQCSPTGSPPGPSPSSVPSDVGALPQDDSATIPSGTPITLPPGPQGTPLVLPPG